MSKSKADVILNIELETLRVKKQIKDLQKMLKTSFRTFTAKGLVGAKDKLSGLQTRLKKIKETTSRADRKFAGYALSIMFFGMALSRIFNRIWKGGTKTFNDIQHSVDGTVTGFDKLQGSIAYMGYTAGQALEPLAEMMIPLIDILTNLIERHQTLFRIIVVALGVGGTVLTAIGMLKLAYDGLYTGVTKLYGVWKKLKKFDYASIGKAIGKIGDKVKVVATTLSDEVIASMKWMKANPVKGIMAVGVITGIITVLIYLWKLKDAMGGWGELVKSIGRGVVRTFMLISGAVGWAISGMVAGVVKAINWVIEKANNLMKISWVKKAGNLLGFGDMQISKIHYDRLTWGDAVEGALEAEKKIKWLAPEKGYADSTQNLIPQYDITVVLDGEEIHTKTAEVILNQQQQVI